MVIEYGKLYCLLSESIEENSSHSQKLGIFSNHDDGYSKEKKLFLVTVRNMVSLKQALSFTIEPGRSTALAALTLLLK